MRKLLATALLVLVLPSCTLLEKGGTYLCEGQTTVSGVVTDAGGFFGPIGAGAATVVNALLDFACGLTDEVVSAPERLWQELDSGGGSDAATGEGADTDTLPVDG